jgi:hypothetical protein
MVLYFGVNDVKDMVSILKGDIEDAKESPQKANILNQIIQSCTILSTFAEKSENNIFRKYVAVMNSLKELAWENEDVRRILEQKPDEDISGHFAELVKEFDLLQAQKVSNERFASYEE